MVQYLQFRILEFPLIWTYGKHMGRLTKHGDFHGKSATTRKLETKVLIMRNLIMLMLIQGLSCLMLSSKQVLNMWVIPPLVPAYFDTSWDTELMQPVTYSQWIGFTKGQDQWRLSAHLIKNDLVDQYKQEHTQAAMRTFASSLRMEVYSWEHHWNKWRIFQLPNTNL